MKTTPSSGSPRRSASVLRAAQAVAASPLTGSSSQTKATDWAASVSSTRSQESRSSAMTVRSPSRSSSALAHGVCHTSAATTAC
ncbi:hypothetical protein SF12_06705 [Streptomyces sp. MBRL 601]|nr:hypothetical protein SF12_06705 [Streptomyces sp. MBRL 601]